MKRRELIKTLAMAIAGGGTFFFGGRRTAEAATVWPYDPYPLMDVGEVYRYSRNLKITFVKVTDDHRCRIGMDCEKPGNAKIHLRIRTDDKPAQLVTLNSDTGVRKVVVVANDGSPAVPTTYAIRVKRLTPSRPARKEIPQSYYQVQLSIRVIS